MQQIGEISLQISWPLFEYKSSKKVKKFWDKQKKQLNGNQIILSGILSRLGKKQKKSKHYFFKLDCENNLFYFKKETDSIPKGKLQLNEFIQISLQQLQVMKEKFISIIIQKTPKITYKLYHIPGPGIFDWWNKFSQICTINNYDEMYFPIEELGKGSFASVFKVKRFIDGKIFAAKYYYRETFLANQNKEKFFSMIQSEIKILRSISHPCIIKCYEVYQQPDKIVIIMECVTGKDLYNLIKLQKRISEPKAAFLIYHISDALRTINDLNYVHRDLKLENILIENHQTLMPKIVDFGFAEQINPFELISKSGTPGYIAPEVFINQPYTGKGDVFSLGIILFSMICGYSPFRGRTYKKIMDENKSAIISFDNKVWQEISQECKDLVIKMTVSNPTDRISFAEILEHKVKIILLTLIKWIKKEYIQKQNLTPFSEIKFQLQSLQSDVFKSFDFKTDGVPRSFYNKSNKSTFTPNSIRDKEIQIISEQQLLSPKKTITPKMTKFTEVQSFSDLELDFQSLLIKDPHIESDNIQFLQKAPLIFYVNKNNIK